MATYDLTSSIPSITSLNTNDILNCPYSGTYKSITLPPGQYKLECWGAEGGYRNSQSYSGKGGYSTGTIDIKDNTIFYLYSGGQGRNGTSSSNNIYSGGFNGGGHRYGYYGGGGGTDIRINSNSLYARIIVAGGGGSDGAANKQGMYGGGTVGGSSSQSYGTLGYGGTQTGNSGGSSYITTSQSSSASSASDCYSGFGFGGNGVLYSSGYGGAGGGGWYGGTGSYPDNSADDDRGGGGGSGYVYTSSTANNYPSGCLLTSDYYLTNTNMIDGSLSMVSPTGSSEVGHYGNGYIRITVLNLVTSKNFKIKINNEYKNSQGYVKINNNWYEIKNSFIKVNNTWKKIIS